MYLELVAEQCRRAAVAITGYCLTGNHVHLVVRPETKDGLARSLGRAHNDYARWFHVTRGESGHLWQNRFYSSVLDWQHQWCALRYVELNPVRAGLVAEPGDWTWSSAAAHLTGVDRPNILDLSEWSREWNPDSWGRVLQEGVDDALLVEAIRQGTRTGRPAGSAEFIAGLEARLERRLRPAKRGPKRKGAADAAP